MRRGELYRVRRPGSGDPKKSHVFVVVSREALIRSRFSDFVGALSPPRMHALDEALRVALALE